MDKNIGKKLDGRYEITELIGVGGMADVYKANDIIYDKQVAVKILKKEFSENEEFLRRFRNESKAIAVLSHPNIVKILDVGFTDKIQFIVMEYIDGITLKEYMNNEGKLSWKDSVHFLIQILRALQHAHDRGIVHRDIKPQNIMLFPDGTIKVMDFGIAKFAREEGMTATSQAIGSVHYISPEQARGDVTNEKSDIYSVGILLYEMLTSKKPFDTDNPVSVALMHMQNEAIKPRDINPDLPVGLEEIILHAMEKEPEKRYHSAAEMIKDIERFKANTDIIFGYSESEPVNVDSSSSTRFFKPVIEDMPVTKPKNQKTSTAVKKPAPRKPEPEDDFYETDEIDVKDTEEEYIIEEERSLFVPILSGVTIIVIIAAVFFVSGLAKKYFGSSSIGKQEIAVQDFIGRDINEVRDIYKNDFSFEIDGTPEYTEYPENAIVYQSIESGTIVKAGTKIIVKISKGEKLVTVPAVATYNVENAKTALGNEGLAVMEKYISDPEVKAGLVIKTEPTAKEKVKKGTVVFVYVSTGPEVIEVTVPKLEKTNINDAEIVLKEMDLIPKIEYIDDISTNGTVVKQSIAANTKIQSKSEITLYVSNGNPPTNTLAMTLNLPKEAVGTYRFDIYVDGTLIDQKSPVDVSLTTSVTISLKDYNTKEVTVKLINLSNNKETVLGRYKFDFKGQQITPISEAIYKAFEDVEGLAKQTVAVTTVTTAVSSGTGTGTVSTTVTSSPTTTVAQTQASEDEE
jgi:serine/threonine protein kinase